MPLACWLWWLLLLGLGRDVCLFVLMIVAVVVGRLTFVFILFHLLRLGLGPPQLRNFARALSGLSIQYIAVMSLCL